MGSWFRKNRKVVAVILGMTAFFMGWGPPGESGGAPPPAAVAAQGADLYNQALELIRAGKNREAMPLLEQALPLLPGNRHVMADYTANLVWTGDYRKAVTFYTAHLQELHSVPFLQKIIAKAFYELREFRLAREHYERAWKADPRDEEAFKGLIFSCCRLQDYSGAADTWEAARQGKLVSPGALADTRIFILENLGASAAALKTAQEARPGDAELIERLTGDLAVNRLQWEDIDLALTMLEEQLARNPENSRARCDYIVALRQKDRMQEILGQHDILARAGKPIPFWVNEAVADAYLYLQQPEQAVKFYQLAAEQNPTETFNPLKGLFYCYVELRRWRQAEATLRQLEDWARGPRASIAQRDEVANLQGQWLISQDKNKEAAASYKGYLGQAGLDPTFRNGLAQAYYNRGWPRRAMEQFKVTQSTNREDKESQIGMAYALNELNYKEDARRLAQQLYSRYPTDYHVKNLKENLRVEDSPYVSTGVYFTREYQGATEYYLVSELNVPYSSTFRLFSQVIRQAISDKPPDDESLFFAWNRLAFGFDWIMLPQLQMRQAFSFDYLTGRDFGSFTQMRWRPTDPLRLMAEFDSFALNIPIRARATGIKAKRAAGEIAYNESDLRNYGIRGELNMFADNNKNPGFTLFFNQKVINHPDVKVWAGTQFNYYRYTKQDVAYFSPLFDYTWMFTPTIHWIHYQRYDRKFRSSFYPRGGINKEIGFDFYPVGGITYEPTLVWSKTLEINGNISYDTRVYDGEYTHVLGAYFGFKKYF